MPAPTLALYKAMVVAVVELQVASTSKSNTTTLVPLVA